MRERKLFPEWNGLGRLTPVVIVGDRLNRKEICGPKFAGNMGQHFIQSFAAKVFEDSAVGNEQRVCLSVIEQPLTAISIEKVYSRIKLWRLLILANLLCIDFDASR